MNLTKLIAKARVLAERSNVTEYSHGAVLVRGGKIIAEGWNKESSLVERVQRKFGVPAWTLHAEMACLLSVRDPRGAVLFVSGFKRRNGHMINCRPCKACQKVINELGVECFYSEYECIRRL